MNAFLTVLKRELKALIKRPDLLIALFTIPFITCFSIGSIFIKSAPRNLPIAILNQDNSEISRILIRMIDATPSCETKYSVTSLLEGKELIKGGKAYALVVIPRNFKRNLLKNTAPQVAYYYNNQAILIGGIISKDITTTVLTFSAGIDVKLLMKKGLPKDIAKTKVNLIGIDEHVRANPYMNYSYFLCLAGFIHTFQVLIAALACWSIGREFKHGTTKEWMKAANNSIIAAVFGKLTPFMISFLFIIAIVYLIYFVGYGVPFLGSVPFVIFATILYIFAYQITAVMFVAITSNFRLSLSSCAFYTALGFTFAGMTYPIIAMPLAANIYSFILPLRHYLAIVIDQSLRGIPYSYDWKYIGYLLFLIFIAIVFLPLLKKNAMDEKKWYKL